MEGRHMVDLTNDLKPAAVVKTPKRNKNKEKKSCRRITRMTIMVN